MSDLHRVNLMEKETLLKDVSKCRPECTDLLHYFRQNISQGQI
jgi:hypothetical protein